MATEGVAYLTYVDAVLIHIELMRQLGETRYGWFVEEADSWLRGHSIRL